jgi:hypothetical protein
MTRRRILAVVAFAAAASVVPLLLDDFWSRSRSPA